MLEPVEATGAALLFEGEVRTVGEVPSTLALREIGRWLDARPRERGLIATASLGQDAPQFELLTAVASGLLATPVSTSPGEYLIWLRPERVRTVTWGGNPFKPALVGDDPVDAVAPALVRAVASAGGGHHPMPGATPTSRPRG